MPIEILMPALSPTMTEGNLAKWLKQEGDKVKPGDVIAEIETDKATMEVESIDEGVLGKILIPAGTEGVAVNSLIALLLAEGEDKKTLESYKAKAANTNQKPETGSQKPKEEPIQTSGFRIQDSGSRTKASPLARRIAAQAGMDLSRVTGTGPHGRIIKADVEESLAKGPRSAPAHQIQAATGRSTQETIEIPNSTMRKVIAKRLLESKLTIPHFYLSVDCEMDVLLAARTRINDNAQKSKDGKPAYKLSVNDFVIKAVAQALRTVPAANASWTDAAIIQYTNVDVSVAVAIEGGLITPIIRNADQKTLSQISAEMKDLAVRARENKLRPEEFQGGGFSISNLGMYGIKNFQAIVNPPQSGILAVGATEERVVVKKGQMTVANIMSITLSSDHRVVDGTVGAEFLTAFKRYIEEPVMLVV